MPFLTSLLASYLVLRLLPDLGYRGGHLLEQGRFVPQAGVLLQQVPGCTRAYSSDIRIFRAADTVGTEVTGFSPTQFN